MDLRQLEIVRMVADTGSFTAASRRLHVSQSAVSRQVLLLEEELGEPLFLRLGRRVRLTDAGESLLQLSRRVLADIRDTTSAIVDHQQTLRGTVQLGGGMTVCLHVFPALLKEFRRKHPEVEVKLTTGGTRRRGGYGATDASCRRSGPGERAGDARGAAARDAPVAPACADAQDCGGRFGRPAVRAVRAGLEHTAGCRQDVHARAGQPAHRDGDGERGDLKALVLIGMGITIIPYQAVTREVQAGRLRCVPIERVSLVRETGWVYLRTARVPRAVQQMFEALQRTLPRLTLAPPAPARRAVSNRRTD